MRTLLTSVLGGLLAVSSASAAAGIYDPFAIVNDQFYDLGANTALPDYHGTFLGAFDAATGQIRLGGQQKTFENSGTDVFGSSLQYRIYLANAGPNGAFTSVTEPFQRDLGSGGDAQWGTDVQGANPIDRSIIVSLANLAPGTYTLELSSFCITNAINAPREINNDNGGSHFQATFTVVPEPSSFALGIGACLLVGSLRLLRRRA